MQVSGVNWSFKSSGNEIDICRDIDIENIIYCNYCSSLNKIQTFSCLFLDFCVSLSFDQENGPLNFFAGPFATLMDEQLITTLWDDFVIRRDT